MLGIEGPSRPIDSNDDAPQWALQAGRSKAFVAGVARAVPLGPLWTTREVAHAALFLAPDDAAYIAGTTIIVDGGQIVPAE